MKHKVKIKWDDIFKQWVVYVYRIGFSGQYMKTSVKYFKSEDEAIRFAQVKKKKYLCQVYIYDKSGNVRTTI